ncbi:hypothetical protein NDU88_000890 [Pleurodeles waltl]|uniref:Uncharacterized protein n=1 Tax=Pleurodeles waltl TaxID=8319 RepID=A0AAV7UUE7_PLEWA|nr:hypothetical protein NDU88_000890 [Pleurodeles waltl]
MCFPKCGDVFLPGDEPTAFQLQARSRLPGRAQRVNRHEIEEAPPSGPHGDSSPDLHPPLWAGGGSRRKAKATTPSFPRRASVSPSVPPIRQTPPQGKTTPAASWRGHNCCGRAHSRPAGLTALWSIRRGPGRGSRPTHGANCPSPVVILPQDLPRGEEAPFITHPQPRHATVPRSSPRLVEGGGEPLCPISWRGGGGRQGRSREEYGLNALARWVAPGSAHPPLLQNPEPRPARRGRQDGGRSFQLRSAPQQHLSPAARSHLESSVGGERPQKQIPPQGYGSGAPGAPRNYFSWRAREERLIKRPSRPPSWLLPSMDFLMQFHSSDIPPDIATRCW